MACCTCPECGVSANKTRCPSCGIRMIFDEDLGPGDARGDTSDMSDDPEWDDDSTDTPDDEEE